MRNRRCFRSIGVRTGVLGANKPTKKRNILKSARLIFVQSAVFITYNINGSTVTSSTCPKNGCRYLIFLFRHLQQSTADHCFLCRAPLRLTLSSLFSKSLRNSSNSRHRPVNPPLCRATPGPFSVQSSRWGGGGK